MQPRACCSPYHRKMASWEYIWSHSSLFVPVGLSVRLIVGPKFFSRIYPRWARTKARYRMLLTAVFSMNLVFLRVYPSSLFHVKISHLWFICLFHVKLLAIKTKSRSISVVSRMASMNKLISGFCLLVILWIATNECISC